MDSFDKVVRAFEAEVLSRPRRDFVAAAKARCPGSGHSNGDQHGSLEIDEAGDGTVLVLCRVCGKEATRAILARVGLALKDLAPPSDGPRRRQGSVVAAFDYADEGGVVLYQVCRVEPGKDGQKKTFFQRRPVGGDQWAYNLDGVRRVLYRLPELLEANPEAVVYVPEGEAKVDALRALGQAATCCVGGAKKWLDDYNPALRGRTVVLLPDNDAPGREHAALVAKALAGVAEKVVTLELPGLPPKGDVLDWLAAGGTRQNLEGLTAAALGEAKPLFPNPVPASQLQAALEAPWILHGYLARGEVTLLSALWKVGKTTLLAHLLRAMHEGGNFCGHRAEPSKVLYVSEESQGRWAKRRDAVGIFDNVHFLVRPFRAKPDWAHWMALVDHLGKLQERRPADLIVLDTLSNLWPVKDENDAANVQTALMPLHAVTKEKTALLLVHHNRKGDGQEATASRGSGALTAWVDTIVELRRFSAGDRDDRRRVLTAYGRDDETPAELVVELKDGEYQAQGTRETSKVREVGDQLLMILPSIAPGTSYEGIKELWQDDEFPRRQRVLDALDKLAEERLVIKTGEGVRGDPFRWWAPPPG